MSKPVSPCSGVTTAGLLHDPRRCGSLSRSSLLPPAGALSARSSRDHPHKLSLRTPQCTVPTAIPASKHTGWEGTFLKIPAPEGTSNCGDKRQDIYMYKKMNNSRLRLGRLLCLLLPLLPSEGCPPHCSCSSGRVDCSGRMLTSGSLPTAFPRDVTAIQLHDNQLSSLPNGLLDGLPGLRSVTLHGNPWVCDCGLLYLRSWLLKQEDRSLHRNVTCSSPPALQGRLVMYLVEEEVLQSCRYWYCNLAVATQVSLGVFIIVQVVLLLFFIFFLHRFQKLSLEAQRAAEDSRGGRETENENEYE
ncbi:platelet glycoprotein Ib beta chain [Arapaima gigas]